MTERGHGGKATGAANTTKVARRRAAAKAEETRQPRIPPRQADHRIPQRVIDLDGVEVVPIGQVLAGVQDFKILRSSIAVLSLTTSPEFMHTLADAAVISRGSVLVADLYEIPRTLVFAGLDDEDEDEEDDA